MNEFEAAVGLPHPASGARIRSCGPRREGVAFARERWRFASRAAFARRPGAAPEARHTAPNRPPAAQSQMLLRFSSGRTIGSPGCSPKAARKDGRLASGPFTRNSGSGCGSVCRISFAYSGRMLVAHDSA